MGKKQGSLKQDVDLFSKFHRLGKFYPPAMLRGMTSRADPQTAEQAERGAPAARLEVDVSTTSSTVALVSSNGHTKFKR
jgi:hypothetical protein